MARKKTPDPLLTTDDKHLTIRVGPKAAKLADKVVEKAWKEELQVMGRANPVRVKHSHVLKLAAEIGLPLVLEKLREMQAELPAEEAEA